MHFLQCEWVVHDNNLPSQHGLLFPKATLCPTRVRANGIMVAAQLKGRPKSTVSGALWTEQASGVKTAEVSKETIPIPKKKILHFLSRQPAAWVAVQTRPQPDAPCYCGDCLLHRDAAIAKKIAFESPSEASRFVPHVRREDLLRGKAYLVSKLRTIVADEIINNLLKFSSTSS